MNSTKQYFKALFVLLCLLTIIVFSISQIINMAKLASYADTTTLITKQKSNPLNAQINMLIQSQSQLSYKDVQTNLLKTSAYHLASPTVVMDSFNIGPELEKLPANEQDYAIRLKLFDWKFENLQTQLEKASLQQEQPLIFKTWFWLYSIIIWAASIIGGRILNHYTDKFLGNLSEGKSKQGSENSIDFE
jgi:hypothetical protein